MLWRERLQVGVKQGVLGVQEAADDVHSGAALAVADDRHLGPRRWGHDAQDGDGLHRLDASHQKRIAVREHDHLAGAGPGALAVGTRDPAASRRDDMEPDEALGAGMHHRGEERTALVG